MTVSLAKPVDLTNTAAIAAAALAAYEDGTLQAVKNAAMGVAENCKYVGPCAIGVSLDAETQCNWDTNRSGTAISSILADGLAVGDRQALGELQAAHDHFAVTGDDAIYEPDEVEEIHLKFLIVTHFYAKGLDK